MASSVRSKTRIGVLANRLIASGLVFTAMWVLWAGYRGFHTLGDLRSYKDMYDNWGGYLRDQGRDPLFVWLIQGASLGLGPRGFDTFRLILFALWSVAASYVAWISRASAPVTAVIVICCVMIKGAEQLREGLAFLLISLAVINLYSGRHPRPRLTGLVSGLAALIHWGAVAFSLNWLAAALATELPNRPRAWRRLPRLLLFVGVLFGLICAVTVSLNGEALQDLSTRYSGMGAVVTEGRSLKYLYWALLGGAVFLISKQVTGASHGASKFAYAYALVLGRFLMPLSYVTCATLVFINFPFGAVLELFTRGMSSIIELALFIILVRGRATIWTAVAAAAMFANQLRSIIPDLVPFFAPA
jgi:hypothetical protein